MPEQPELGSINTGTQNSIWVSHRIGTTAFAPLSAAFLGTVASDAEQSGLEPAFSGIQLSPAMA